MTRNGIFRALLWSGAGALAVTAGVAASVAPVAARTPSASAETGHLRIERVFDYSADPWTAGCGSDYCAIQELFSVSVKAPDVETVDIVVTVTMDYRTTPGDYVVVDSVYGGGPRETLRPRGFRLASSDRTTTTLTWSRRNVPAAGARYSFASTVNPRTVTGSGVHASGRKLTLVIDMEPSGP